MKIFGYELSEWRACYAGDHDPCPNWFRSTAKIVIDNAWLKPHIGLRRLTYEKDPKDNSWKLDITDCPDFIQKLLESRFNSFGLSYKKIYRFDELDQAKQDIDNLILQVNKLKCFL